MLATAQVNKSGKRSKQPINLLELRPERQREWERDPQTGLAVILIPKFEGKLLGKLLQPRLKDPFYKVNLDEYGTAVWECCDGATPVAAIASTLQQRFGEKIEPLTERLSLFVQQLEQKKLVRFANLAELRTQQARA